MEGTGKRFAIGWVMKGFRLPRDAVAESLSNLSRFRARIIPSAKQSCDDSWAHQHAPAKT